MRDVYQRNFGIVPSGDIREIAPKDIPSHDVLCAGFPCQPFSKAGDQLGFECPRNGDLFSYVVAIIEHHNPTYLLLENVPNLKRHNNGGTWQGLVARLEALGYEVQAERLSPHEFGIPQIRERIFIVGSKKGLSTFAWPRKKEGAVLSIDKILDKRPKNAKPLSEQVLKCLQAWQAFLDAAPADVNLPGPLWSMEFGATYPYEQNTPHSVGTEALREYKGSHGASLKTVAAEEVILHLPSYARTRQDVFPEWKVAFIRKNREFYRQNRSWIDKWLPGILAFPPSLQKLEWNCRGEERNIWNYVVQFRASGVRVKRRTTAPSLVAMTSTQVPIIAWEKRYMTVKECARLQSMSGLKHLPDTVELAYSSLGNAVNAHVAKRVAKALIHPSSRAHPRKSRARSARQLVLL